MRTLRKRIEELEYRIVRQDEKYHKELSDLRKRVGLLEKKAAATEKRLPPCDQECNTQFS